MRTRPRLARFLALSALLLLGLSPPAHAQTPEERDAEARVLDMRPLRATASRVGNSLGGTFTLYGNTWRVAVPATAEQVGIETDSTGKKLLRVRSGWSEGVPHTMWYTLDGRHAGGVFDFPWSAGGWVVSLFSSATDADRGAARYVTSAGLVQVRPGGVVVPLPAPDAAAATPAAPTALAAPLPAPGSPEAMPPGWAWRQDRSGLVITGPDVTLYSKITTDNVAPADGDASTLFSPLNRFRMDWRFRGGGRETRGVPASTLDPALYPTDARLHRYGAHRTILGTWRENGVLRMLSGSDQVDVHRWDADAGLMVPEASVIVRPDSLPPAALWPGRPDLAWGEGLVWRDRDGDGHAEPGEYRKIPSPGLWQLLEWQQAAGGDLWLMPYWEKPGGGRPALLWPRRHGSAVTGGKAPDWYDPAGRRERPLPAALTAADACGTTRVHRPSGDLVAVVRRGEDWRLERYPGWARHDAPATIAPAWSTPRVGTRMRRGVGPHDRFSPAMVGAVAAEGEYVFLAEGIGCGVRVYRRSDGAPVGRAFSPDFANSTVDEPRGGLHVWRRNDEYVCSVMDFNGSAAALWRVKESELRR